MKLYESWRMYERFNTFGGVFDWLPSLRVKRRFPRSGEPLLRSDASNWVSNSNVPIFCDVRLY